jgi:hypothetical protein
MGRTRGDAMGMFKEIISLFIGFAGGFSVGQWTSKK